MPTQAEVEEAQLEHLRSIRGELAVQLYQNQVAIGRDTVLADFTPCSFPGYAHFAPAEFGDPIINAERLAEMVTPLLISERTETGAPQTIRGYLVVRNTPAGPELYAAKPIEPVTLTNAGDKHRMFVRYKARDIDNT